MDKTATAARRWAAAGAALAALAVVAGAFGAHGLRSRLDPVALDQWHTAARYLMYGGLGATLCGLSTRLHEGRARLSAIFLVSGGVIFFLAVGCLALGGPRILGAVAPIGGLGLISGFLLLAFSMWQGEA